MKTFINILATVDVNHEYNEGDSEKIMIQMINVYSMNLISI